MILFNYMDKMLELQGEIKKWGNSAAIRLSRSDLLKSKLQFNQRVKVLIIPKNNVLKEMFGTFKFKEPVEKIMKESDKLLYND